MLKLKCYRLILKGSNRLYSTSSLDTKGTVKKVNYDNSTLKIPQNSTIFSMIQPTNHFHIGNYLGTVKVWKDLTNNLGIQSSNSNLIFGIADLHALTKPKDPKEFKKARLEAVASIIASGIDPSKAIVFNQSAIPEHTELNWILCCLTGMGYLNRMTQWKSKSQIEESSNVNVFDPKVLKKTYAGIFMYPVLQAADILIYRSTHVPVGDDQSQHLELCRNIAEKFNKTYKEYYNFPIPQTILAPTKKILSLRDPSKKMSKSDIDKNSCIYITEEPGSITKKLKKSVTDSIMGNFEFDPINRPGVSNLINIVSGLQNKSTEEVVKDINSTAKDHSGLKDYVTEIMIESLAKPRLEFEKLMNESEYLNQIIIVGNEKAKEIAAKNMKDIKNSIGL